MKKAKRTAAAAAAFLLLLLSACGIDPAAGTVPGVQGVLPSFAARRVSAWIGQAPAEAESPLSQTASPEERLSGMSLREKVGQMFFVCPEALTASEENAGAYALSEEMRETLQDYPAGGIVLFSDNIQDPDQLRALTRDLQQASAIPLFIGADDEGGKVVRIASAPGFSVTQFPLLPELAAEGGTEAVREMGRTLGGYLQEYGVNTDFAPVADVADPDQTNIVSDRAFGTDPQEVSELVTAEIEGLHETGTLTCAKHYPGHGSAAEDTHESMGHIPKTWEELRQSDLLPLAAAVSAGTEFIMTGHLVVEDTGEEETPASLSPFLVSEKLRGELGYTGIIITDSLSMGAITESYDSASAAVLAVKAGNDMLLMPEDYTDAFNAVLEAVENGEISEARIDESARRILQAKAKAGLLQ